MKSIARYSAIAVVLTAIVCVLSYIYVDRSLAVWIHQHITAQSWLYQASQKVVHLGDPNAWMVIVAIGLMVSFICYHQAPNSQHCKNMCYFFVAMAVAMIISIGFKFLLGRYRPQLLFQQHLYGFHYFINQFSINAMPSGHATRIFAAATALTVICRRSAVIVFIMALLVAAGRLFLGLHFLSDVIFGAMIGILAPLWVRAVLFK